MIAVIVRTVIHVKKKKKKKKKKTEKTKKKKKKQLNPFLSHCRHAHP